MTPRSVEYDRLADRYEDRYRVNPLEGIRRALRGLVERERPRLVAEIGCGTGHWLRQLSEAAPRLVGMDLSVGMLAQARDRETPGRLLAGKATTLPLRSDSANLLFVVNAVHHFGDVDEFAQEASRVLLPGGLLAIIGVHPEEFAATWYPYEYFEGNYDADVARFPSRESQRSALSRAGFGEVHEETVDGVEDHYSGNEVLRDPFLIHGSNSSLAQLTEEEYAEGLRRIEDDIETATREGREITFTRSLDFEMLSSRLS